jgi:hypothetical protein
MIKKQKASGSSVATALAAGQAGLLLYSQRLLLFDRDYHLTMLQRQKFESWQRKGLSNQAFKALAGQPNETMPRDLYVALGSYFDSAEQSGFGGKSFWKT